MNQQIDLEEYIDGLKAREERDKALKRVIENAQDWSTRAVSILPMIIEMMPPEFSPEELRTAVSSVVGEPHHHNAWGALTNAAIRQKLMVPTGQLRQNRKKKSHARVARLYKAVRHGE